MTSRIADVFARLRADHRTGLVTYVTGGDPDGARSAEILRGLNRVGADVLEVGVPFSDPLADGPVIQRASERALAAGGNLSTTLDLIAQLAIPLMLLTLGVAVARLRPSGLIRAFGYSLLKIGFGAVIAWSIGKAFGLEPTALAVLTVQLSTPVAVANYLLAEKYDTDPNEVAGLVVVSTLVAVVTLPLTLAFFV